MVTFLHAADIHLDSPLKNLATREGAPVELIRNASRRAFDNLVQLAIDEKVDFLLLVGDLYDGAWRDFNTGLFFIEKMRLLKEAGIRVFFVSGNHDAASRITKALRLPDNVVHFSSRKAQSVELEDLAVAIHGQSYSKRAITSNLAKNYPEPVQGMFNIGLLHTALAGRDGHEPYAPCTTGELADKGYDYWALGHVHTREIAGEDPWIVFPGNLQGRHIRETGPKGAMLVKVENGEVKDATFKELDVVRWEFLRLDCREISSADELLDVVRATLEEAVSKADGRPLMLRLELHGPCGLHADLLRDERYWQSEFDALAIDIGDLWLERVLFHTRPLRVIGSEKGEGSSLQGLLASACDATDLLTGPELRILAKRLPGELFTDGPFIPESEEERRQLLREIRDMVLAKILPADSP
jgi:DNA repair exonuclease SbcCD nuclease subunit